MAAASGSGRPSSTVHQMSDSDSEEDFKTESNKRQHDISVASSRGRQSNALHRSDSVSNEDSKTKSSKRVHDLSDSNSESDDEKNDLHLQKHKRQKLSSLSGQCDKSSAILKRHDKAVIGSNKKPLVGLESRYDEDGLSDSRPVCKYGKDCYRKNPQHLKEFRHPRNDALKKLDKGSIPINRSPRSIAEKLSGNDFNFLLTHVSGIQDKYNDEIGIRIKDILSPDLGNLQASAQFNYCIDIPWLLQQYPPQFRSKPLLIVHGEQRDSKSRLDMEAMNFSNVKLCQARLEIMYGTHHTKMMFLLYDTGMRIVIHTSNLVQQDWHQKTQGVWISPLFPKLADFSTKGDSKTNFKADLIEYLTAYKASALTEWITHIQQHDLSSARVCLVASVPGRHVGDRKFKFGHMKLRKVLSNSGPASSAAVKSWPVIGQFSSIGSLGSTKENWLCGEWLRSLTSCQGVQSFGSGMTSLKLVYPSKENVRQSLEGYAAGASLPYSINTAKKQLYLNDFLHQWKSDVYGRSQASPHIKTYTRMSPDYRSLAWFLVTSANLSKAAWGAMEKNQTQLMIRSYELGVLFLPKNFDCGEKFDVVGDKKKAFPVPFNVPPTPYGANDRPWIWDIPYKDRPDTKGVMWVPS